MLEMQGSLPALGDSVSYFAHKDCDQFVAPMPLIHKQRNLAGVRGCGGFQFPAFLSV